jgi:arsenical pump membrane protein
VRVACPDANHPGASARVDARAEAPGSAAVRDPAAGPPSPARRLARLARHGPGVGAWLLPAVGTAGALAASAALPSAAASAAAQDWSPFVLVAGLLLIGLVADDDGLFAAAGHSFGTAAMAGLATVVVNNLPAASLLAARTPEHPFALMVGLNLGPNLCVTGSLAWLLWLRAARAAGARPSLRRASLLGAVAVPLSVVVALGALALTGNI